jgi:hypothetical protein
MEHNSKGYGHPSDLPECSTTHSGDLPDLPDLANIFISLALLNAQRRLNSRAKQLVIQKDHKGITNVVCAPRGRRGGP